MNGVPVSALIGDRIPEPRRGGLGEHTSGDLFLAFATGNRGLGALEDASAEPVALAALPNAPMSALFAAVVDATEEAILNALLAAETMSGIGGNTAHRLEPELLLEALACGPRRRPRGCAGARPAGHVASAAPTRSAPPRRPSRRTRTEDTRRHRRAVSPVPPFADCRSGGTPP
jgi:Peptidase family S58